MNKVWVDVQNGRWGMVTDLRVLDVQWWDTFRELFDDVDVETRIAIAKSFGLGSKH